MEKDVCRVLINGEEHYYPYGTTYREIAKDFQKPFEESILLVTVDRKIQELFHALKKDCEIGFLTVADPVGNLSYQRTATMMFIKSVYDVCGRDVIGRVKIQFAIGRGLYCTIDGDVKTDDTLAERVSVRMQELCKADIPIEKKTYPIDEAMDIFREAGFEEKISLFAYRRTSTVNVYSLLDYKDYYYGYMLDSTRYVDVFHILPYQEGLILLLPDTDSQGLRRLDYFEPREKLFNTLMNSTHWGKTLKVESVGDLNDSVCDGGISDLILVSEALQEHHIGEIARDIRLRGGIKFVMIAGPSSSGKTTFSHRLSIQLRANGLVPHTIGVDDYFKSREDTPRDEDGNYDFECLEAINVDQFNDHMQRLMAGETVQLPRFNFLTGQPEAGRTMRLGESDILVIEGIHGLNDKLSYSLPVESKYKIYISALTFLNVDDHNRIPTTDGRILRRLVRDARTRGASAKRTLAMWPSVRRGEEKNIFPFQEKVDATFNSVLIYEIAVLKQYAEPLLFSIKKDEPEYYEARRLLKFLEYFMGISSEEVPANSIVREFIGGSLFDV